MYSLYDLEVAASRLECEFDEEKCINCKCYVDILEPNCVYNIILGISQQLGALVNQISLNTDNMMDVIIDDLY